MTTSKTTGLRPAQLPSIERVKFNNDPVASRAWEQMRTIIDTRFGKGGRKLDKAVTWDELVEIGLVRIDTIGTKKFIPGVLGAPSGDAIPPAPTGLIVTPGLAGVILTWNKPTIQSYSHTEIWRADTNDLTQAVAIGETSAWHYIDHLQDAAGVDYWYWIRLISTGGKRGKFNAVAGTHGAVSLNPSYLVDVLSAPDPKAPLFAVEQQTTLNGAVVPPGIYLRDTFMANGSVGTEKIGHNAVTVHSYAQAPGGIYGDSYDVACTFSLTQPASLSIFVKLGTYPAADAVTQYGLYLNGELFQTLSPDFQSIYIGTNEGSPNYAYLPIGGMDFFVTQVDAADHIVSISNIGTNDDNKPFLPCKLMVTAFMR